MPLMHWNLVLMALLSFTAQPLLAQRTDSTRNTTATVIVDGSAKQMESDTLRRFFTYARDFDRDLTFLLVANSSELFALPFIDHTLFFSSLPINLGNIGSPLYPLYFGPPNQRTQWMSGTQSTADYHYLPENTPLFSLARPYTELTYQLGSFEEHWFQAEHAQAFAPKLYAGFSYRHINSKGAYQRQDRVFHNGRIFLRYASPSNRYKAYIVLTHNDYTGQENGGLLNDSTFIKGGLINGSNFIPNANRATYPVRLNAAARTGVQTALRLSQCWQPKADSSGKAFPLGIHHNLEWSHWNDTYTDAQPDSSNYTQLAFLRPDARAQRFRESLQQEAGIFWAQKSGHSISAPRAMLSIAHEYYQAGSKSDTLQAIDTTYIEAMSAGISGHHLSIQGQFNQQIGRSVQANLRGHFFLTGFRQGDVLAEANFHISPWNISGPSPFSIAARIRAERRQPAYFDQELRTHVHQWTSSLQKEESVLLSLYAHGSIGKPKGKRAQRGWMALGMEWQGLNSFVWFNEQVQPQQSADPAMVLRAVLQSRWNFGVFKPRINVQLNYSSSNRLPVPLAMCQLDLGIEALLFKKNLNLRAGIDASYLSDFQSMGYSPSADRFLVLTGATRGNFVMADVYINARIKSVGFFVRLRNAAQELSGNPYMLLPGYPLRDRYLQLGLVWGFVN